MFDIIYQQNALTVAQHCLPFQILLIISLSYLGKHFRMIGYFKFKTSTIRFHIFSKQSLPLGLSTKDPQSIQNIWSTLIWFVKTIKPIVGEDKHNIQNLIQPKFLCKLLLHIGRYFHVLFLSCKRIGFGSCMSDTGFISW